MHPTVALPIRSSSITLTVFDGYATASTGATFSVVVNVAGFERPLVPIADPPAQPIVSLQSGRTLPLKLALSCAAERITSFDIAAPQLARVTRISDRIGAAFASVDPSIVADMSADFRSENTNWIYNLSTADWTPGTYELAVALADGTMYHTLASIR